MEEGVAGQRVPSSFKKLPCELKTMNSVLCVECPRAAAQPPVPLRYEDSGGVEGEPAGWPAADQRLAERLRVIVTRAEDWDASPSSPRHRLRVLGVS